MDGHTSAVPHTHLRAWQTLGWVLESNTWLPGQPRCPTHCRVMTNEACCCARAAYVDSTNTLGHMTGEILTSMPLGKGGVSPYDMVPTCILQAGDHLFHDEVRGPHPYECMADGISDMKGWAKGLPVSYMVQKHSWDPSRYSCRPVLCACMHGCSAPPWVARLTKPLSVSAAAHAARACCCRPYCRNTA